MGWVDDEVSLIDSVDELTSLNVLDNSMVVDEATFKFLMSCLVKSSTSIVGTSEAMMISSSCDAGIFALCELVSSVSRAIGSEVVEVLRRINAKGFRAMASILCINGDGVHGVLGVRKAPGVIGLVLDVTLAPKNERYKKYK